MTTENNQIFRITYEAFSKFSNNLNRCRAFEEIADCFAVNLKYMFNYYVYRASYCRNSTCVHLESTSGKTTISVENESKYLEYEKVLLNESIPKRWTDISHFGLTENFAVGEDEVGELWGWNFGNDERQMIVSVFSGSKKKFSQKDINFLKLVSENLETKLLELSLNKELGEKNDIISRINDDQKEVIKERTKEIANKNKTLLEISVLNAHNIREPLSRILGLVNLLNDEDGKEMMREIMPFLKSSANDLDAALQSIINHATEDLLELKA